MKIRKAEVKNTFCLKVTKQKVTKGIQFCPTCAIQLLGWKMKRHIKRIHPRASKSQIVNYQSSKGGLGKDQRILVKCPVCTKILYGNLGFHLKRKIHKNLTDKEREEYLLLAKTGHIVQPTIPDPPEQML